MTTVIMRSMKLWKSLHDRNLLCSSQINNTSHKHTPWCVAITRQSNQLPSHHANAAVFGPSGLYEWDLLSSLLESQELWPKSKWAISAINGNQCWLCTKFGIMMSAWILNSIQLDESLSLDDSENTTRLTDHPVWPHYCSEWNEKVILNE